MQFFSSPEATMIRVFVSSLLYFVIRGQFVGGSLQELYNWKVLDYSYPSGQKLEAIRKQDFIPENNLPVGIEVWMDKIFVTVPRWKTGTNL